MDSPATNLNSSTSLQSTSAGSNGKTPVIQLRQITKTFSTDAGDFTVLKGIDAIFFPGEFIGVIGKSGSGKTTLVNMITGIDRPTTGEVYVEEVAVHKLNENKLAIWRGKHLGIVFQFFQLLPTLTLVENVMLPMDFCKMYAPRERKVRAMELLSMLEMEDHANKLPTKISGGQQQRVAIARALANDPPIILADEPTGNLDSKTAGVIFDIFNNLVKEGKTVIMVTHDSSLARRASRTLLIADGEIVNEYIARALPLLTHQQMLFASHRIERMTFEPGATIIQEGAPADRFYIITRGRAEIALKRPTGSDVVVFRPGVGEYFGEVELTRGGKNIATAHAIADAPVELVALDRETFIELLNESDETRDAIKMIAENRAFENIIRPPGRCGMTSPRWKKILKDLTSNKFRTLLVVFTIWAGVVAVGWHATTFDILVNDMDKDYQSSNPHAAIIYTDPFDSDLLDSLAKVPGVGTVDGRAGTTVTYLQSPQEKKSFQVTGIDDPKKMKVDLVQPVDRANLPVLNDHEVLVERSSQAALGLKVGDLLPVQLGSERTRTLKLVGFFHDVNAPPYIFTNQITGIVNPATLTWLEGPDQMNQVYLTVLTDKRNEAHVQAVAADVAKKIQDSGRQVYFTLVFSPGRHYASDITQSLSAIMSILGFLVVILGAFLVINIIYSLLGQQIRQIGVMKAVGARRMQLVAMYLGLVLIFGLCALTLAIPVSTAAALVNVRGIAQYLNFNLANFRLPTSALIRMIIVALVIPVGAAFIPVLRGTRITIREAISSYGLGTGHFGRGIIDRLVEKVHFLPRPVLLSLRNTFRRKGRLILTLITLILAGAIFIACFNLKAAFDAAIYETFGYILADVNMGFGQTYRLDKIEPLAKSVPGVVLIEGWQEVLGDVLTKDEKTSTQVQIVAPPNNSTLIKPVLTSGRWLVPQDENAIVIGNHLLAVRPELKVGDTVKLTLNDKDSEWKIVGTYRMAGNVIPPIVYANSDYVSKLMGLTGQIYSIRAVTDQHDLDTQKRIGNQLQQVFKENGIQVGNAAYGAELIQSNISSLNILIIFMLIMASFVGLVGGLGMMSTMSMNVIERTREIGVVRAIGASNGAIYQIVLVEGIVIGVISWLCGALLAFPISFLLDNAAGVAFLKSPLKFVFSWDGFLIWLAITLVISTVASLLPARSAAHMTVREVLAYE